MMRIITRAAALTVSVLLAACGGAGSGGTSPAIPGKTASSATATFVVKVPAKASVTSSKRAAYITSNVKGIDFTSISTSNSTLSTYVFYALTPSSSYCTGSVSAGLTCTLPVSAPPGQDSITVNLYDAVEPGQAYILSTGSITQTINDQQSNTVNITTNGVPTFGFLSSTAPYPPVGTATAVPLSLELTDPDGNIIVGSFDMPVTVSDSDTTGATTLSKTSLNQMSDVNGLSLNYNGVAIPAANLTVSSTSPALAGRVSPTLTTFTVAPGGSGPVASPAVLYFANPQAAAQTVTLSESNGSSGTYAMTNGCGSFANVTGSGSTYTIAPVASTFSATAPLYYTYGLCTILFSDQNSGSVAVGVFIGQ
ncbi:MAG TPA: hypothetical protein VFN49_09015 [Candidatus Aquilonibacter sp.]|nr:hypothetical protein [Candidatus Aquilonibacter sp.]